jgi:hypothetical protein
MARNMLIKSALDVLFLSNYLVLLWHFRFYTQHWSLCSLVLRRGLCGMRLIFALLAQKLSAFQESPFRSEGAKRPMLRIPCRVPK